MEELMGLPDGIVASVANMSGKGSRSREGSANTILADQCSLLGMSVAGPVADWLASTILRPHAFRWEGQGEAFDVAGAWPPNAYWMAGESAPRKVLQLAHAPAHFKGVRIRDLRAPLGPPLSPDAASTWLSRMDGNASHVPKPLRAALEWQVKHGTHAEAAAAAEARVLGEAAGVEAGEAAGGAAGAAPHGVVGGAPAPAPTVAVQAIPCGRCTRCKSKHTRCWLRVMVELAAGQRTGARLALAGRYLQGLVLLYAEARGAELRAATVTNYSPTTCKHMLRHADGTLLTAHLHELEVQVEDAAAMTAHIARQRAEMPAETLPAPPLPPPPARGSARSAALAAERVRREAAELRMAEAVEAQRAAAGEEAAAQAVAAAAQASQAQKLKKRSAERRKALAQAGKKQRRV